MTELAWKGGKRIIKADGQDGLEATYLLLFKDTKEGKDWFYKNKITKTTKEESPDYIFETEGGKNIGLEITNLVIKTDKQQATVALRTIANQVCQHFKKEKGIALCILIDFWDKRKWCARTYKEMMAAAYDPGFRHLEATNKEIKTAIINVLSQQDIKPMGLVKTHIEIGSQIFNITATRWDEPHTEASVNNQGACVEDPFEELQAAITAKNNKFDKYKNKCDECDLLVVVDSDSNGNFVCFSNKIKSHKFESAFRNVYLFDLNPWDDDRKMTKLKTKHI
jgi:hypothetical protein